jgi:uncharacterized protein YcnI
MSQWIRSVRRRVLLVLALVAVAMIGLTGSALAHVTVQPGTAEQGSYAAVVFRVPNEEATANTTGVVVTFPTDHPIAEASTRQVPGWTVTVEKTKLATPVKRGDTTITDAVSKVRWTGGKLPPGSYEDFPLSLSTLPTDTDHLTFTAAQTYDNGKTVNWADAVVTGAPEPEHPSPILKLTAAVPDTSSPAAAPAANSGSGSSDATARWLGGAGLAAGVLGLALGAAAMLRARRRA